MAKVKQSDFTADPRLALDRLASKAATVMERRLDDEMKQRDRQDQLEFFNAQQQFQAKLQEAQAQARQQEQMFSANVDAFLKGKEMQQRRLEFDDESKYRQSMLNKEDARLRHQQVLARYERQKVLLQSYETLDDAFKQALEPYYKSDPSDPYGRNRILDSSWQSDPRLANMYNSLAKMRSQIGGEFGSSYADLLGAGQIKIETEDERLARERAAAEETKRLAALQRLEQNSEAKPEAQGGSEFLSIGGIPIPASLFGSEQERLQRQRDRQAEIKARQIKGLENRKKLRETIGLADVDRRAIARTNEQVKSFEGERYDKASFNTIIDFFGEAKNQFFLENLDKVNVFDLHQRLIQYAIQKRKTPPRAAELDRYIKELKAQARG